MKFETLKKYDIKKLIIILLVIIVLLTSILFLVTRAKYKVTESIPLASGTINYTLVDFELAGIKFKANNSEDYEDVETIEDNYELNQEMSYCTEKYTSEEDSFEDVKNDELTINFDKENKTISVSPYSKKGTKCYLFFDEELTPSNKTLSMLKQSSKGEIGKITGTACDSDCALQQNGIYEAEDDYGTSYVYRGTVDNNWVVFGQDKSDSNKYIWWRIIRINGNGTIRLIYAGTSSSTTSAPSTTGETTMIKPRSAASSRYPRSKEFNKNYNDNTYVGYMIGATGQQSFEKTHTNASNSTVLDEIKYWYETNTNLGSLAEKYIDVDTGFCGDRGVDISSVSGYTGAGYGTQQTAYTPWARLYSGNSWKSTQAPTLKCGYKSDGSIDTTAQKRDLYTGPKANVNGTKGNNGEIIKGNNKLPVPVGLITSDEVVYAGGFGGQANNGYWLYTNQYYWTMSPCGYYNDGSSYQYANVFRMNNNGDTNGASVDSTFLGVRPVINLKADTMVIGSGIASDPYVVS